MELDTLKALYIHELKDLYSAEKQSLKAMPKMMKAATDESLAEGFRMHLEQTKEQVTRLEQILKSHGESTRGPVCKGMQGLIAEGEEMLEEDGDEEVLDAGIISSAQRIEHYEIAGYGCARTYAEALGDKEGAQMLQATLQEEIASDKLLTKVAKSVVNLKAAKKAPAPSADDDGGEDSEKPAKKSAKASKTKKTTKGSSKPASRAKK
jgi:ferritin-like metal-binding protein YciE